MIQLYKCQGCSSVFDEVLVRVGWRCCSSMFFNQVEPTKVNILKYVIANPIHAIKRILTKED